MPQLLLHTATRRVSFCVDLLDSRCQQVHMAQIIAATRTAYSNPSRNSQRARRQVSTGAHGSNYCRNSCCILQPVTYHSTSIYKTAGVNRCACSTHRHDRVADWNPPHKRKHLCRLSARCVCGSARWSDHTRCRLEPTTGQLCPRQSARSKVPCTPFPSTQIGSDRADSAVL